MKQPKLYALLFVSTAFVNLYSQYASSEWLNLISKPLMMPLLVAWLFASGIWQNKKIARYILIALFSSWLGDIFMIFQQRDAIYFILGLSTFLMAHVFYIITYKVAMFKGTNTKMRYSGQKVGCFLLLSLMWTKSRLFF